MLEVNQVDWQECVQVLGRLGLVLPHEEQWEFAARAGTTTPWWTGTTGASVGDAENLLGEQDGFAKISPVGSLRANPFGLYDVLGNASEWCRNRPYTYGQAEDASRALRLEHEARGGNARGPAIAARVSMRLPAQHMTQPTLGLRPAREVTR